MTTTATDKAASSKLQQQLEAKQKQPETPESTEATLEERMANVDPEVLAAIQAKAKEEAVEEAKPVTPKGFYSNFCNTIYVGGGKSYEWPPGLPFDMEQVQDRHKEEVADYIDSLISRGYAYRVK